MVLLTESSFIGGHRILDFVNTVEDQDKRRSLNALASWSSFIAWGEHSTMFNAGQVAALKSVTNQAQQNILLIEIEAIKEQLYQRFKLLVDNCDVQPLVEGDLQDRIKIAFANASLKKTAEKVCWVVDITKPDWIVDSLLLSAEQFLREEDLAKLRQCKRCTWLFLNSGRGRGRQWCSMKTCGNRAKSAAFRDKKH